MKERFFHFSNSFHINTQILYEIIDRIVDIKEQKEHVYVRCLIIWNTFVLTAYYTYLKSWKLHSYGLEAILTVL